MAATPDQELFAAWPSSYVQRQSGARLDTSTIIEAIAVLQAALPPSPAMD
jgi:hypothetical protein